MTKLTKAFAAPAVLAALSLTAVPAAAAELPTTSHHADAAQAASYGGRGWGWGGYRHRRDRVDAGDVLAGVLILGTIAAVANAAKKANRPARPYPAPYPNPDRRYDYRPDGPQGLEGAADLCLREVERNARARDVTRVERNADGWMVTGEMADGAAFSCSIGADGRIDRVDVGGRAQGYAGAVEDTDRQYDDDRYRSARADVDAQDDPQTDAGPQPAYPGGPLPGEEEDGAVEATPDT